MRFYGSDRLNHWDEMNLAPPTRSRGAISPGGRNNKRRGRKHYKGRERNRAREDLRNPENFDSDESDD